MNHISELSAALKKIREETPYSIREQALEIGINYNTLLYLDDAKALNNKTIRLIKSYIKQRQP